MITESRIKSIEDRLDELTYNFIQAQKAQIPIVSKISNNTDDISRITPYTEAKTAYFNEKEKTFYNVPQGNVSASFDNYSGDYSVKRVSDRVTISFETLTELTNITISVK